MAAQLELVEAPAVAGPVSLDDDSPHSAEIGGQDEAPRIAWPVPSDFSGLLMCANGDCGKVLQFRAGRAQCERCGVAQMVSD